jgi:hypothetical protein
MRSDSMVRLICDSKIRIPIARRGCLSAFRCHFWGHFVLQFRAQRDASGHPSVSARILLSCFLLPCD